MKNFDKLYTSLLTEAKEILSKNFQLGKEKEFSASSFCTRNPEINNFAFTSPKNMFIVMAFVFFTMQRDWPDVSVRFPLFLKWFFEKVLDKNDEIQDITYNSDEPFIVGATVKTRSFGNAHVRLAYIWNNRNTIFKELSDRRENEFDMLFWILDNIDGLGLVKSGFLIQLITGKYGCIDSINAKVLNKILSSTDFDIKKSDIHSKKDNKTKRAIRGYVDAVNHLTSKVLWDDWCDIVAMKIQLANPSKQLQPEWEKDTGLKDNNRQLKLTLPGDKGWEKINPYKVNKSTYNSMLDARDKFKTGYDVGKDHLEVLRNNPYRENTTYQQ